MRLRRGRQDRRAKARYQWIGYTNAGAGPSNTALLQRLGICDQVKDKIKIIEGRLVAAAAAADHIGIGIQQTNVIPPYAGTEHLGPLPAELMDCGRARLAYLSRWTTLNTKMTKSDTHPVPTVGPETALNIGGSGGSPLIFSAFPIKPPSPPPLASRLWPLAPRLWPPASDPPKKSGPDPPKPASWPSDALTDPHSSRTRRRHRGQCRRQILRQGMVAKAARAERLSGKVVTIVALSIGENGISAAKTMLALTAMRITPRLVATCNAFTRFSCGHALV
jgi:hypothetical protein